MSVLGSGGGRARSHRHSAAPDRRPWHGARNCTSFFAGRASARPARRKTSADLEETSVALITSPRPTAMLKLATQLLVADEGKRGTEMFVLDYRGL